MGLPSQAAEYTNVAASGIIREYQIGPRRYVRRKNSGALIGVGAASSRPARNAAAPTASTAPAAIAGEIFRRGGAIAAAAAWTLVLVDAPDSASSEIAR